MDRWVRNRKWWWSMLFWSLGVLLTNAYKVYLNLCKEEGVEPIYKEHYQFRKAVAKYWINPEKIASEVRAHSSAASASSNTSLRRKRVFDLSPATMSTISLLSLDGTTTCQTVDDTFNTSKRGMRVTDATLAETGKLRICLNRCLDHLPEAAESKARCALHWWACKKKIEAQILVCLSCNVNLCVQCFALFHRTPDLVSMKQRIKNSSNKKQKKK